MDLGNNTSINIFFGDVEGINCDIIETGCIHPQAEMRFRVSNSQIVSLGECRQNCSHTFLQFFFRFTAQYNVNCTPFMYCINVCLSEKYVAPFEVFRLDACEAMIKLVVLHMNPIRHGDFSKEQKLALCWNQIHLHLPAINLRHTKTNIFFHVPRNSTR